MSEPNNTQAAGEGVSDEEMIETVAGQTDSASDNADTAGNGYSGPEGSAIVVPPIVPPETRPRSLRAARLSRRQYSTARSTRASCSSCARWSAGCAPMTW